MQGYRQAVRVDQLLMQIVRIDTSRWSWISANQVDLQRSSVLFQNRLIPRNIAGRYVRDETVSYFTPNFSTKVKRIYYDLAI